MNKLDEANQRLGQVQKKLAVSVIVNGVIPVVLYALLRNYVASDATALAISGAVPVVRTLALLVWRRRIDWIGVISTVGCAAAATVALLSGGNPLALKIYHSVLTGSIGLALLISVLIGKPLVLTAVRAFGRGGALATGQPEAFRKKFSVITAVAGLVFTVEAAGNILLAQALSTGEFLVVSKVVKWVVIAVAVIGLRWWMSRRNQGTSN